MHHDGDPVLFDGKQVPCLDNFQALVHQGSRIDGNLGPHVPVRVGDGLGRSRRSHSLARPVEERAAGRRQDDARHPLGLREIEHLKDRVMLGIDRQQRRAAAPHFRLDEIPGADQALLVRERNDRPLPHGTQGRLQAGGADDPGHHPVGRPVGRLRHRLRPGCRLDTGSGKPIP